MSATKLPLLAALGLVAALGCSRSEAAGANYQLRIDAPKEGKVGQAGTAVVRVTPRGGWKVNLRYPIRLRLQPPAAVAIAKAELAAADAKVSEQEARFEVGYTVTQAGAHTVTGELKFSVCDKEKCDIKKEAVTWTTTAR